MNVITPSKELRNEWINSSPIFRTLSTGAPVNYPPERIGTDWDRVINQAAYWGYHQALKTVESTKPVTLMNDKSMINFSPCNIEVLLHCYCSPEAHPREDAPAVKLSYRLLEKCGLIEGQVFKVDDDVSTRNKYKTTERGRAHVKQLCTLPLPSSAWVNENGKLIELN